MEREEKIEVMVEFGYRPEDYQEWYNKYYQHRAKQPSRGLVSHLTFRDYMRLVNDGGLSAPAQIGRKRENFVLARFGDQGNYEANTCRFIPRHENVSEAFDNGRHSDWIEQQRGATASSSERVRKSAETKRGRNKETHGYIARHSELMRGRTKETHLGVAQQAAKMLGRIKLTDEGIRQMSEKNSKGFVLVDPEGHHYEGKNLFEFCKTHGLTNSCVSKVCSGEHRQYKGWTGFYVEEPDFSAYFHDEEPVS